MTKEELREKALALGIAKSEINKCTNKAQIEELIAKVESSKTSTETSDDDAAVLLGGETTTDAGPVPSEAATVPGTDVGTSGADSQPTDDEGPAAGGSLDAGAEGGSHYHADSTPAASQDQEAREPIGFHPVTGKPVYHVVD
jgi:hypothetical protein